VTVDSCSVGNARHDHFLFGKSRSTVKYRFDSSTTLKIATAVATEHLIRNKSAVVKDAKANDNETLQTKKTQMRAPSSWEKHFGQFFLMKGARFEFFRLKSFIVIGFASFTTADLLRMKMLESLRFVQFSGWVCCRAVILQLSSIFPKEMIVTSVTDWNMSRQYGVRQDLFDEPSNPGFERLYFLQIIQNCRWKTVPCWWYRRRFWVEILWLCLRPVPPLFLTSFKSARRRYWNWSGLGFNKESVFCGSLLLGVDFPVYMNDQTILDAHLSKDRGLSLAFQIQLFSANSD